MDHLSVHGEDPTTLEEFTCTAIDADEKVKTIGEYAIRGKTGTNIIGYKTPEGRYILNPTPDTKVSPGSKFFVLGTPDQVSDMQQILNSTE